jgi:MFS family permease
MHVCPCVKGVPGYFLAALLLVTLKDPTVENATRYGGEGGGGAWRGTLAALSSAAFWEDLWGGITECATHLRKRATFVHLSVGMMIQVGAGLSIMAFLPTFLVRCHHMTTKSAGVSIAEVGGVFGGAGIITGGLVGDWLVRTSGDQRWMLWFILACNVIAAPLMVVAVLVDDRRAAIFLSAAVVALFMVMVGPPGAIVQSLVPNRMRATAAGFFAVLANLVGGSLGPLCIGYLSDRLRGTHGDESIRYALAWSMLFCVWGQVHWFLASRAMPGDVVEGVKSAPLEGVGFRASGGGSGGVYDKLIDRSHRRGGGDELTVVQTCPAASEAEVVYGSLSGERAVAG